MGGIEGIGVAARMIRVSKCQNKSPGSHREATRGRPRELLMWSMDFPGIGTRSCGPGGRSRSSLPRFKRGKQSHFAVHTILNTNGVIVKVNLNQTYTVNWRFSNIRMDKLRYTEIDSANQCEPLPKYWYQTLAVRALPK